MTDDSVEMTSITVQTWKDSEKVNDFSLVKDNDQDSTMTRPDVDINWVQTTFHGEILDKEVSDYVLIKKDLNDISKMLRNISNAKIDIIDVRMIMIDVAGWQVRG